MKAIGRLGFDAIQAVAFLIVIATLAPRAVPSGGLSAAPRAELAVESVDETPSVPAPDRVTEPPGDPKPVRRPVATAEQPPGAREAPPIAGEVDGRMLAKVDPPPGVKDEPPLVAENDPPSPVAENDPPPPEAKTKPQPRVAIGFDPAGGKPAPPALKEPPARDKPDVAPAKAVEEEKVANPRRIRVVAPHLAGLPPPVIRPFNNAAWMGPRVIARRAAIPDLPPPPPPRPGVIGVDTKPPLGLDPHAIRQYWERDVEQFRALERAGYPVAALQFTFRAKYRAVRLGAHASEPLSQIPEPPKPYLDALSDELKKPKP